jgi:DNA polymerase-3 subunit beta
MSAPAAEGLAFEIERAPLHAALQAVLRTVEKRNTIPILGHFHLSAIGEDVHIRGTDLDVETVARIKADVRSEGTCTVPAQRLAEIVALTSSGVRISIEAKANRSTLVRAGRSRYTLPGLPTEDFPELRTNKLEADATTRFDLPGSAVAAAISAVSFAISTEETRYYLNGIFVHAVDTPDGTLLRACTTDGKALARYDLGLVDDAADLPEVIIPRKAVELLKRVAESAGDQPVRFAVGRTLIRFEAGDVAVLSKLIDGTFPKYDAVIPQNNNHTITVASAALVTAAKRVGLLSSDDMRPVVFMIEGDKLTLSAVTTDGGEAVDEVDIENDGDRRRVAFSSRLLSGLLGALPADVVALQLGPNPGDPAIFRPAADSPNLCVLMPFRA